MPTAEHTVVVNRDIDTVFDFLADGTNNPQWRTGIRELSLTSASGGGLGATYRQVMTGPGGRPIAGDYRITTFERPRRLGFEVIAGPARPTGLFELIDQAPSRTEVRFRLDLRPRGIKWLMAPLIAAQMRREVTALATLKTVLDNSS